MLDLTTILESLLASFTPSVFTALLRQFFTDSPTEGSSAHLITLIASPSPAAAEALAAEEKALVAARVAALGEEGLEAAQMAQEAAQAANAQPVPTELMTNIPVPCARSVDLRSAWSWAAHEGRWVMTGGTEPPTQQLAQCVEALPAPDTPLFLVHAPTAFATLSLLFPTQSLTLEERRYVWLSAMT